MTNFDRIFNEMISGVGGVWGSGESIDQTPSLGNDDFYARGDARVPKILGGKRSKKKKGKTTIPMFKRNFPETTLQ